MATTSKTQSNQSSQSSWQQLKTQMSQGSTPYILVTAYAIVVPLVAILNLLFDLASPLITDVLFVLLLGVFLVIHKSVISDTYKLVLAVVLLAFVVPWFGMLNQFYMDVLIQVGMFIVLALGLNIVVGFAGLLDLGYIAFYAVGAYLWAIFSTRDQALSAEGSRSLFLASESWFPLGPEWFFVFFPLALVIGAITGLLLGLPVLRLRGDYLAIVTLGFGEVIRVIANNLDKPTNITNGPQGIKNIGEPPQFLSPIISVIESGIRAITGNPDFAFNSAQIAQLHFYTLVWLVVGVMLIVVTRLTSSRIGRAWTAIREDETAALAMGVPLVRMKLMAFAVGASFAGVMGMIFAAKQTFINPPTFDVIRSIMILSMVILGGMGSIPGAVLGATLVTLLNLQLLPRLTSELSGLGLPSSLDPSQYQRMIFGLLLIIMTIFRPQGLLPENRRRQELVSDEDDEDIVDDDDEEPTPTDPNVGIQA